MAKGGSKLLTGIVAFLLGFIFAILVEVGAVVGVYFYIANSDLDNIFNTLGIQNKDEDGNYIYVNTDNENGGAKNVGELLTLLQGYLKSEGSSAMDYPVLGKSLDEISNLLPIVHNTLSSALYPKVSEFVDVDWEEFEGVAISELPQFLSDALLDIRPAKVLEKMGMDGLVGPDANVLVNALIAGAEFDYAYSESGLKFPVYYDTYTFNEELNAFYRDEASQGRQAYPDNLSEDYLFDSDTKNDSYKTIYRLYYIPCTLKGTQPSDATLAEEGDRIYADGTTFIAVKYDADEDKYVLDLSDLTKVRYPDYYGYYNIDRTGNFYYANGGEADLQIYPVTVGSFSDPNEVFKPLYCTRVTEIMEGDIIGALFGNHSVGELVDGKIDIDNCVNNLELAKVINVDPEEQIMAYIGYGLTGVKSVGDGRYTGFVDVDGVSTPCHITTVLEGEPAHRNVSRIWYEKVDENGKTVEVEVHGVKVKQVSSIATGMEITALLDVKADDAILSYLGYGLKGVIAQSGTGYTHTAKCEVVLEDGPVEVDTFINTDADGVITDVWYLKDGEKVSISGTTIDKIADRVNSLIDMLTLPDVLDIKADQTITAYIGYGLTHIAQVTGEDYTHTADYKLSDETVKNCFLSTDAEGKILSVWYMEGEKKVFVKGTTISDLPDRIDGISQDLTLADVMDISPDDNVLWALRNSKIADLGSEVKNLKVSDVLTEKDFENSAILKQLKNKSINDLSTAIDAISVQSIYTKEIYKLEADGEDPKEVTAYEKGMLYFVKDSDGAFVYVNNQYLNDSVESNVDKVGVLTEEEFNEGVAAGTTYYSYGQAKEMWRLILFKNNQEKVYTLNNFGNMINTCTGNINNATLLTLQEAGILDETANLNKTLTWYENGEPKSRNLGEMTLKELISAVISLAS